jgi:hypothetical protein
MRPIQLAFGFVVIVLFLAAPASAGTLGLLVAGDLKKQPVIETTLEPWLASNGHQVRMGILDEKAVNKIVDCFILSDQRCAEPAVKQVGLDRFLFVMVELSLDTSTKNSEITIKLTGWLFLPDGSSISAKIACKQCSNETLIPTTEELARTLFEHAAVGTGRISVTSAPAGATVAIDGALVGTTPFAQSLRSGPHVVVLELGKHKLERREVAIAKGETIAVNVAMQSEGKKTGSSLRRNLPYILMGSGAALALTGMVLFAADQDCLEGGPCDVGNDESEFRNSAPVGLAIAAAGGAAIGTGAYLYIRGRRRPPTTVASPWVTSTTAGIAFGTRF